MKRLLPPAILSAAALALVACGSGGDDDAAGFAAAGDAPAATAPSASAGSTAADGQAVGILDVEDVGTVLTDAEGKVLYLADEETDPDVLCTDACEEFWVPAEAASDPPSGDPAIEGELAVAERPDGTQQLTLDGRRLYSFSLDEPGEAGGEGFSDTFDGQRFTWHVALATASDSTEPEATDAAGGGATTDTAANDVFDYPGY